MQNISVDTLKARLDAGEKITLVDVRQPNEHSEFNIGGLFVPLGRIQDMDIDELESLKDQELICYCRSGNRSGQACVILDSLGFKNTKNLTGGMIAWREKFAK